MIQQHVCIPMADWCIDIYYDVMPRNADFILDKLEEMGCPERHLYKAEDLLKSGEPNEGLTYSSQRLRKSLVVIGQTTDPFQFFNSCAHECQHIEQAICKYYGLDPYGEDIAYVSGAISEALSRNAWRTMKKIFLHLL